MKITRAQGTFCHERCEIHHPHDHHVNDLPLTLHVPIGPNQLGISCGASVAIINLRPNDEIGYAGFVLRVSKTMPEAVPGRWGTSTSPAIWAGDCRRRYTIITTVANELVATIHDKKRMPVIIAPEN